MGAAGFGAQANALLRKSATFQRRNVGTNCCLLSSPIFFCILLFVIRTLVNSIFFSGEEYECGCQCTRCCQMSNLNNCTSLSDGYCDEDRRLKCLQFNSTNCGLRFSTPVQSTWCEVPDPSSWPPIVQVSRWDRRARPWRPNATVLVHSGGPLNISAINTRIITAPFMDALMLQQLMDTLIAPSGRVNLHLLTKYGFTFGSWGDAGNNLYLEKAVSGIDPLVLLLPVGGTPTCQQLGYRNEFTAVPFNEMVLRVVRVTSGNNVTQEMIAQKTGQQDLGGFFTQETRCVSVNVVNRPSVEAINRATYCGYKQARCNGTMQIDEYAATIEYLQANTTRVRFTVGYNDTENSDENNGGGGPAAYKRIQRQLSSAVESWFAGVVVGGWRNPVARSVRLLGVMSMPKLETKLKLDFSNFLGPLFYTWVVQLLLPTFLQQLVYEKEKRLRMMMKMHGLGDGAYWLITYLWYLLLYCVYIAIFMIFGAGIGLEVFRRTSVGVQAVTYFLFGNCMIAFAFMLSSLFSSSRTATVVAFLYVFASGLIGELLLKVFMEQNKSWIVYLQFIPAWSLFRSLWEMAEYSFLGVYRSTVGLTFAKISDPECGIRACWAVFGVEWALFLILGAYLEQTVSSGTGMRRHPLFFLEFLWKKEKAPGAAADGCASIEMNGAGAAGAGGALGKTSALAVAVGELEDVKAERARVEALTDTSHTPILVKDLRKIYPPLDGGKPKLAVRTLTLGIERGECFGLLGPNGAGKSTSINMLTGFLEPSSGTALIEGFDITKEMPSIYHIMGVCPQHDLLWEQLTGEEHLLFYGRLKGLKGAELTTAVKQGLQSVNLWNNGVGRKQCQKYSGGMKRRLSVAISFMGDPRVVYLDEPSTGLDPASRRNLWDVVKGNKDGRAMILTTHSMEEAEMLCDRLGIFVDGQLVCIGNPKEITSRYAGYLVFTLTVEHGDEEAARGFVTQISPNSRLTYALGGTLKYELPTSDISLAGVFDAMAEAKGRMRVLDWGVANATLEEVFIKFARQIGAQSEH